MDLQQTMTTTIPTARAERFAKQFISHWGRKGNVEAEGDATIMKFAAAGEWPATTVRVEPSKSELIISVWTNDRSGLEANCESIATHLHRFAGRNETLTIEWTDGQGLGIDQPVTTE